MGVSVADIKGFVGATGGFIFLKVKYNVTPIVITKRMLAAVANTLTRRYHGIGLIVVAGICNALSISFSGTGRLFNELQLYSFTSITSVNRFQLLSSAAHEGADGIAVFAEDLCDLVGRIALGIVKIQHLAVLWL